MEHLSCNQLLESLSDYIDGTLDPSICQVLEEHLDGCQNCQVVYNTTLKTIDLYHTTILRETIPGDVRQRLFLRLKLDDYLKKDQPESQIYTGK